MMQHPTKVPSFLLINIVNIWCGYRLLASLSLNSGLCWVGLLLFSMSASHTVGCGFTSQLGHTKDHLKKGIICFPAFARCVTSVGV